MFTISLSDFIWTYIQSEPYLIGRIGSFDVVLSSGISFVNGGENSFFSFITLEGKPVANYADLNLLRLIKKVEVKINDIYKNMEF